MATALKFCIEEISRARTTSQRTKGGGGGGGEQQQQFPVVVVASCESPLDDLAEPIRRQFTHELALVPPGETRRAHVINHTLRQLGSHLR